MRRLCLILTLGLLVPLVVLTSATAIPTQDGAVDPERAKDRTADLRRLEEWVLIERSLDAATRVGTIGELAGIETTGYTDAEFYMLVRRITARADNGHSNVVTGPILSRFGALPLRVFWFADGLRVARARDSHGELAGARIERIEGRPVEAMARELMAFHGGHEAQFRAYVAPRLMISPVLLHAVDLAEAPDRLRLGVTLLDGTQRDLVVEAEPADPDTPLVRPWQDLLPPTAGDGWAGVLGPEDELPMFLREPGETFRYRLLEDGQVAYVQLRNNFSDGERSVRDFVEEARAHLERDRPAFIVLDNRFNPGGDLTRTADFALALPELSGPAGYVFVLTSGATFSAGIYTSFYPKAADPERTTIIGEHVGDRTRFWAETWRPMLLPDSGWRLAYSLQLHDLAEGCGDPERCHIGGPQNPTPRWNVAVGDFEPDIAVPLTFEDYRAGRDAALERALAAARVRD